jgi:hypothetical protein
MKIYAILLIFFTLNAHAIIKRTEIKGTSDYESVLPIQGNYLGIKISDKDGKKVSTLFLVNKDGVVIASSKVIEDFIKTRMITFGKNNFLYISTDDCFSV